MKKPFANPALRGYALAVVAGLLLAASFPKLSIAGLAWIAPALMLAAAFSQRGAQTFRIGYVAGLVHYLASLYWLLLIAVTGFPILGWFALSSYLALYPATWVWLCCKVFPRTLLIAAEREAPNSLSHSPTFPLSQVLAESGKRFRTTSWTGRAGWALCCAATWVALEMLIARMLSGFPWDLLGVSQYRLVPLIQIASVTGVYGVSFVVVWTSVSFLLAALATLTRPTARYAWMSEIALPFLVVLLCFVFGLARLKQSPASTRELKVTLIQPSIPQTFIWDASKDTERFAELVRLTELAVTNRPDLLIWPEAAIPKLFRYDEETFAMVTGLARSNKAWLIVGADDAERRAGSSKMRDADYYNSSFLISPEGKLMNGYRKRSLVMFGEYIPLERSLPFIKMFTPIEGSYASGDKAVQFKLGKLGVQTSVLICFEDVFPHVARESAEPDTDFLVNITNDGWFGESSAQWEHAATAIFRAIENGVPLIRCSNNGLTCWIDTKGRLREIFTDKNGSVYGPGFATWSVPLPSREQRAQTFYNRHGDWFGWACFGIAGLIGVRQFLPRKRAPDTAKSP